MLLIGERNWWLPGWLDRVLPRVRVEGSVESMEALHEGDDVDRGEPEAEAVPEPVGLT
jgi:RND superfamily putative drug exporter